MTAEDIDNNVELWANRIKEASIQTIPLHSEHYHITELHTKHKSYKYNIQH